MSPFSTVDSSSSVIFSSCRSWILAYASQIKAQHMFLCRRDYLSFPDNQWQTLWHILPQQWWSADKRRWFIRIHSYHLSDWYFSGFFSGFSLKHSCFFVNGEVIGKVLAGPYVCFYFHKGVTVLGVLTLDPRQGGLVSFKGQTYSSTISTLKTNFFHFNPQEMHEHHTY